jgi:hypothetical protein
MPGYQQQAPNSKLSSTAVDALQLYSCMHQLAPLVHADMQGSAHPGISYAACAHLKQGRLGVGVYLVWGFQFCTTPEFSGNDVTCRTGGAGHP